MQNKKKILLLILTKYVISSIYFNAKHFKSLKKHLKWSGFYYYITTEPALEFEYPRKEDTVKSTNLYWYEQAKEARALSQEHRYIH